MDMTAQPQFITDSNGDKTAVILTLEDYQELMEDLEDLAAIAELRDEETKPWEQLLKKSCTKMTGTSQK
jgi:PHD/YefM family antitoxin component YafN of YafNO toxin-antitoxin module